MSNEQIQSATIKLETLQNLFRKTITQYKLVLKNYSQSNLQEVNFLNSQLNNIQKQIMEILNNINSTYQTEVSQSQLQGNNLNDVYMNLNQEKDKINLLLAEYNNLDQLQNDTSLRVNSNHSHYRIIIIIAIIIIFLSVLQISIYMLSGKMTGGALNKKYLSYIFFILFIFIFFYLAYIFL